MNGSHQEKVNVGVPHQGQVSHITLGDSNAQNSQGVHKAGNKESSMETTNPEASGGKENDEHNPSLTREANQVPFPNALKHTPLR
jgi:hypothetical protein